MARRVGAKARQIDDRELGFETRELVGLGTDQQRADEQVMPGEFVDEAHTDLIFGLRPAVKVGDEQLVLVGKRHQEIIVKPVERRRVHRLIAVVPPDHVLGEGVLDRELVLGAAAGVLAGSDNEGSIFRQESLAAANSMLNERSSREIPEYLRAGGSALSVEAATRNAI